ncbi:hypothetical protein ON010_g12962 [Phytophthora cinnamomi]|nr:hypothetical protein ON010_g12962 [Phytophthora cinnamomi]
MESLSSRSPIYRRDRPQEYRDYSDAKDHQPSCCAHELAELQSQFKWIPGESYQVSDAMSRNPLFEHKASQVNLSERIEAGQNREIMTSIQTASAIVTHSATITVLNRPEITNTLNELELDYWIADPVLTCILVSIPIGTFVFGGQDLPPEVVNNMQLSIQKSTTYSLKIYTPVNNRVFNQYTGKCEMDVRNGRGKLVMKLEQITPGSNTPVLARLGLKQSRSHSPNAHNVGEASNDRRLDPPGNVPDRPEPTRSNSGHRPDPRLLAETGGQSIATAGAGPRLRDLSSDPRWSKSSTLGLDCMPAWPKVWAEYTQAADLARPFHQERASPLKVRSSQCWVGPSGFGSQICRYSKLLELGSEIWDLRLKQPSDAKSQIQKAQAQISAQGPIKGL